VTLLLIPEPKSLSGKLGVDGILKVVVSVWKEYKGMIMEERCFCFC